MCDAWTARFMTLGDSTVWFVGSSRSIAFGRVLWVVVPPAYFALQLWVVSAWPAPYEFLHHTISDLGWTTCTVERRPAGMLETCSPRHAWFNAGNVVLWILLAAGGILLRGLYAGRRLTGWILGLWIVIAVSGVGVSVVPGDVNLTLHSLLALPLFVGVIAVLFLSARALRTSASFLASTALAAAAISLLGFVGLVIALTGVGPVGLMERLANETIYVWALIVALAGPRNRTDTQSRPATDQRLTG
jgi:hypothetical membrane protein